MPILKREPDQFPLDLLDAEHASLEVATSALAGSSREEGSDNGVPAATWRPLNDSDLLAP
jgi:hypothetical protein